MRTPRARWDSAWKALIQQVFHPWLAWFFPGIAAHVCPDTPPRFLESELQKLTPRALRGPGRVDRLVEVRFLDGRLGLFLIHLEIQSQPDPLFPLRLLYYHTALRLVYGLPVTTLVLLADTDPKWKPTSAALEAPGTRLSFDFSVCKLLDRLPEVEQPAPGEPVFHHVVRAWWMAHQTAGDARRRFAARLQIARAIVEAAEGHGCTPREAIAALAFLDTVAALPAPLEEDYESEVKQIMAMKEDLDVITYRERKAFRKGRQEGREAGRQEGRQAGRQEALRESAVRMAEAGMGRAAIAALLQVSDAEVAAWLGDAQARPGD